MWVNDSKLDDVGSCLVDNRLKSWRRKDETQHTTHDKIIIAFVCVCVYVREWVSIVRLLSSYVGVDTKRIGQQTFVALRTVGTQPLHIKRQSQLQKKNGKKPCQYQRHRYDFSCATSSPRDVECILSENDACADLSVNDNDRRAPPTNSRCIGAGKARPCCGLIRSENNLQTKQNTKNRNNLFESYRTIK